jgi:hypothetical protein
MAGRTKPQRRAAAMLAMLIGAGTLAALAAADARAAIAPWYPRDDEDRCRVVSGAEPKVETLPPPWQVSILRPRGWVGQDPRVYIVPPVLECRGDSMHKKSGWACAPTFIPWAKRNCVGLEIRE